MKRNSHRYIESKRKRHLKRVCLSHFLMDKLGMAEWKRKKSSQRYKEGMM